MRILTIILTTILRINLIDSDCGSPPVPHSTNIMTNNNNMSDIKERYEEYCVVRYECDSINKQLVGDSSLRCLNGRWVGRTPKCGNPNKSLIKKLVITDLTAVKGSTTRILRQTYDKCYKSGHKWYITSAQKLLFETETKNRIDYFNLILFGDDLISNLSNNSLVINAKIERPRKHCILDNIKLLELNSNKTQISFQCFSLLGEISIEDLYSTEDDFIQMISLEITSKNRLFVKYCSLNTFSFSDSCGSPEKPLHSVELTKEKSFIELTCEEDFYLEPINSHKIICGQSGDWSPHFPQCLAKTYCRLPAIDPTFTDPYIHVEYKDLNYLNGTPFAETDSMALYLCLSQNKTNIELIGDYKRICKKGFWTGTQPKCSQISKISKTTLKVKNEYPPYFNQTIVRPKELSTNDTNWNKIHLIVISMLIAFVIGASVLGIIVYVLMRYWIRHRSRRMSTTNIPSVVVSEPNHYYERNAYEEYRYESIRLNALELLELQRINSLYQTSN